jgi:hypothetical protein
MYTSKANTFFITNFTFGCVLILSLRVPSLQGASLLEKILKWLGGKGGSL